QASAASVAKEAALTIATKKSEMCEYWTKVLRKVSGVASNATTWNRNVVPMPANMTKHAISIVTQMAAKILGTTSLSTVEIPIASVSSRILRAPRSAHMADPPTPLIIRAQMRGAAWPTMTK